MKKIYLEDGGFPLTTKTIRHLSEMTEQVASVLSVMAGNNNVIISGLNEDNGNLTAGWVVIAGELYPVVAGASNTHLRIVENIEQAQYLKDADNDGIGDFIDAYFNRYVVLDGDAPGNFLLEDFVRYEDINTTVIKSGVIEIQPSTTSGTVISGDFTSVSQAQSNIVDSIYQFYKIEFEEVNYEYDVVINTFRVYSQPQIEYYFRKVYTAIIDKNTDSLEISFKTIDGSILSDSNPVVRFEITLIKKN